MMKKFNLILLILSLGAITLFLPNSPVWAQTGHNHDQMGNMHSHNHDATPQGPPQTAPQAGPTLPSDNMPQGLYSTVGVVKTVNKDNGRLVIDHEAIEALPSWGAMTMEFALEDKSQIEDLAPGDKVRFDLRIIGNQFSIVDIEKL